MLDLVGNPEDRFSHEAAQIFSLLEHEIEIVLQSNLCYHIQQDIFLAFQTGGFLLLHESSAESSCLSFLHYFHSAISNHLSIAISMSPERMVA